MEFQTGWIGTLRHRLVQVLLRERRRILRPLTVLQVRTGLVHPDWQRQNRQRPGLAVSRRGSGDNGPEQAAENRPIGRERRKMPATRGFVLAIPLHSL